VGRLQESLKGFSIADSLSVRIAPTSGGRDRNQRIQKCAFQSNILPKDQCVFNPFS
jgi:hypothetical protein